RVAAAEAAIRELEAERDAVNEALGLAPGQLPGTAPSAIRGRAATIREQAQRAEQAEQRAKDAEAERDELRSAYDRACKTIAAMHEAATGRTGEGPVRGVVEDVADVRALMLAAEAAVRRVRALGADMRTWCSPHGIATQYADDIERALTGGQDQAATAPPVPEPYRAPAGDPVATLARIRDARQEADVQAQLGMYYGWTAEQSGQRARAYRLDAEQRAAQAEADVENLTTAHAEQQKMHDARRRDLADALGRSTGTAWPELIEHAAEEQRAARQWEEQAQLHARAAEQADAVTAETKQLMQRRTTTLRDRAQRAERRNADVRHYIESVYPGDIAEGVRVDLRRLLNGLPPTYGPSGQPEVITDRAAIRATLDEPEPCPC